MTSIESRNWQRLRISRKTSHSHNHQGGLARGGAEHLRAAPRKLKPRGLRSHHFDGTAGELNVSGHMVLLCAQLKT